ncbi:protein of unknown function [Bradyrhizobium vignae]|uniref:Uncharacterized protein n=1 Tax=Bradyrhizobium vignae TaxID=1549949 RepID=A0A2U3Q9U8_9BRAD|nr:protein of unknown function [Bradyrhizobium vignae]
MIGWDGSQKSEMERRAQACSKVRVAHRQGSKRAKVALARKMAVVLHRMWVDGTEFRWTAVA